VTDYYDGVDGARRLMNELDQLLQHLLDSVGQGETLDCSIKLTVESGESVALAKTYRRHPSDRV
jgi:hypothetical protein